MQSSSKQPLVGEERYVTTLITAAKETIERNATKKKKETVFLKEILCISKNCRNLKDIMS